MDEGIEVISNGAGYDAEVLGMLRRTVGSEIVSGLCGTEEEIVGGCWTLIGFVYSALGEPLSLPRLGWMGMNWFR